MRKNIAELIVHNENKGIYLVHDMEDVGFVPISLLTNEMLDDGRLAGYSDILSAEITSVNPDGAYGTEITIKNISAERIMEFDDYIASL